MARRSTYGVNLAPLIDVVFILLAFMLIYSRMDTAESIEVALPQAAGTEMETAGTVNLSITRSGAFFWGKEPVTEEELAREMSALTGERRVVVQADREAGAEALVKVMSLMARAGVSAAEIKVSGER